MNKPLLFLVLVMVAAVVVYAAFVRSPPAAEPVASAPARQAGPGQTEAEPATPETGPRASGSGLAAIERCATAGHYLFVFFHDPEDEGAAALREVFDTALKSLPGRADGIAINVDDPAEEGIVDRFQAGLAPLPLVLALAPNGAVTGAFASTFSKDDLLKAVVGPGIQQCIKALQENRQVLLCLQNAKTRFNAEAMSGVREYAADPSRAESTIIVVVDPADPAEAPLVERCNVQPDTGEAMTVLVTASGSFQGPLKGATTVETIANLVARACAPDSNCGPSG